MGRTGLEDRLAAVGSVEIFTLDWDLDWAI